MVKRYRRANMAVYNEVPTKDYLEENGGLGATALIMEDNTTGGPATAAAGTVTEVMVGGQDQQKQSKIRTTLHHLKPMLFLLMLILYSLLGGLMFFFIENDTALQMYEADILKNQELKMKTADYIYELIDLSNYYKTFFAANQSANDSAFYDLDDDTDDVIGNCSDWWMIRFNDSQSINPTIVLKREELMQTLDIYASHIIKQDSRDIGNWSFWGSVFYAGTVYSTIGYGNIIPHTLLGRIATIFYAILGIPMMLFTLAQMGKLFCNGILHLYLYITFTYCQCVRDPKKKVDPVGDFPLTLAFLVTFAWMCLCSGVFCAWEKKWDFFLSFYFFFQSLTTIGLGDVTPVHIKHMLSGFLLVIVGMSLVSMCLNLIQLKLERFINDMIEKIRARYLQAELKGGEMGNDPELVVSEIKKIASAQSAFLSAVMTDIGKERLVGEWQKKAALCNVGVQATVRMKEVGVDFRPDTKTETTQCLPPILPHHHQQHYHHSPNSSVASSSGHGTSSSPSHSLEVPYRETRRRSSTTTSSDEFRMKLKELGYILNECNSLVRDLH